MVMLKGCLRSPNWKSLAVFFMNTCWCAAQNDSDREERSVLFGDTGLSMLTVTICILIFIAILALVFTFCQRKLCNHGEFLEVVLTNEDIDVQDNDQMCASGDRPPSYSTCVRSGIISSTASILASLWGSQGSLPDYETVIQSRGGPIIDTEICSDSDDSIGHQSSDRKQKPLNIH